MSAHTPLPWSLYEDAPRIAAPAELFTRTSSAYGDYKSASLTDDRGEFHNPADAAYIVTCVNSHDQLLAERDDHNAAYLSQMLEINALKAKRDELVAAIHEALDYFEDREDVVDGAYGEPAPNKEMSLARVLRDAIKGTT